MGRSDGDRSERPPHRVTLAKPFALGKHEVTVAEWRVCVEDGGCASLPRMQNPTDTTPVHNIHWGEDMAYIEWLRQKTGHRYRLPSEAEWEYAAKAGTSTRFWWGERVDGTKVACRDCGSKARTSVSTLRPGITRQASTASVTSINTLHAAKRRRSGEELALIA